ncbi:MAG TPA: hypothetical protein VHO84_07980 [Syntrophorhabdaceae bacterium]|nr:hypothetical protein [Syntrophorhabdaceae bacterium]
MIFSIIIFLAGLYLGMLVSALLIAAARRSRSYSEQERANSLVCIPRRFPEP